MTWHEPLPKPLHILWHQHDYVWLPHDCLATGSHTVACPKQGTATCPYGGQSPTSIVYITSVTCIPPQGHPQPFFNNFSQFIHQHCLLAIFNTLLMLVSNEMVS